MNKKIMSFVLAAVLAVCFGSSSSFAFTDYDATGSYQQANGHSYGWDALDNSGNSTQETANGTFIRFGSANDQLSGNLSGVFSYYAGIMTGYTQAGGTYYLYDSYGQRAVLSSDGNNFSLQSWSFRQSDLNNMPGDNATVGDWNNYLKSLGFSDEQLRRIYYDNQGNPQGATSGGSVTYQDMSSDLFKLLRKTLSQGMNFSAALSVGDGATGMSLTIYEDNKEGATYVSYGNNDGEGAQLNGGLGTVNLFGESYSGLRCTGRALYNIETGLKIGSEQFTFEFDSTSANSNDQQVGVGGSWKKSVTYTNYDSNGNRFDTTYNKVDIGLNGERNIAGIISGAANSVTYYTSNGSAFKTVNNENHQETFYADNKNSFTKNDAGTTVSMVEFTRNMNTAATWSSDGNEGASDGSQGGTYTVYNYYRQAVGAFNDTDGRLFNGGLATAEVELAEAEQYKQDLIAGRNVGAVGNLKTVYWYESDIKAIANSNNRSAVINQIFSQNAINTMLNFSNGTSPLASTNITGSKWTSENIPEGSITIGNPTRTTDTDPGVTTHLDTASGYTLTTTINAGGSAVFETKCNIITSEHYIDPAVAGTVNRVETINGKQYVVLTNAQVDLADGNGFQSADGEEMYVCIDDLSDEEKANLKVGSTFAAAGYIDTSVEGHYAINNLYEHEISNGDVDNMVQSFASTLAGNAEYQANVTANMVTFAKAAAEGKTYQDWKGGWELLVEYGGGAPALF